MWHRMTQVRADVSEEHITSIIRMAGVGELGTTLTVSSNWSELRKNTSFLCSVLRLLVTANIVPSSPILVTLMMEAIHSSETSVLTRATRRNVPEDDNLQFIIPSASELPPPTNIYNEDWCILGCYAVWLLLEPTFRRNLAPPSSGWQE
jgi:hypothetical protein